MSLLDKASLIQIPSGYKEDKLYSLRPSDGSGDFNFARASTATRVNAEGLIEEVPYNLLTYSEQFDNAAWEKSGATITANNTTAPDGTTTADRLQISNLGRGVVLLVDSTTAGTTSTFSIYAKANGQNLLRLFCDQTCAHFQGATIVTLTNEWVRYSLTVTATQTGDIVFGFDNVNNTTTACNGTNGNTDCFIWGAQLNSGSTAKPYFPTTDRLNVPRLDYSGGASCASLLLEPQRTNLITYSESFDNAAWVKGNATITANATTSPDGTTNAELVTLNTSGSNYIQQSHSVSANTEYTFSFYAKKGTATNIQYNVFDFSNFANIVGPTNFYNDLDGTNWTRIVSTFTTPSGCTSILISPNRDSTSTGTFYLWGAQLEAGNYATSYIPTTGTTVTRLADTSVTTGLSDAIGQTEGTIFLDFYYNLTSAMSTESARFQLSDGSTEKWILVSIPDAGTQSVRFYQNNSGVDVSFTSATDLLQGRNKVAVGYKSGQYVIYLNGVLSNSSTSAATVPATSRLDLTGNIPNYPTVVKGNFNQVQLYKTRLTNTELETLTTL